MHHTGVHNLGCRFSKILPICGIVAIFCFSLVIYSSRSVQRRVCDVRRQLFYSPATIFVVIITGITFRIFFLAASHLITSDPNSLYSELVTGLSSGEKLGR